MRLKALLSGVALLGGSVDEDVEISGISYDTHSTGEGCSAVFFLIFRPSVSPLCYPFLVVHLVHGSRAPIIEPRAKMGSHQRGGWGPVPRIEYIISGGRAQGEGTAEGLALPPR